ncbi:hypothetical protein P7K49_010606, partial [Saguinus oedipus]
RPPATLLGEPFLRGPSGWLGLDSGGRSCRPGLLSLQFPARGSGLSPWQGGT